jgi:hypothetical protein
VKHITAATPAEPEIEEDDVETVKRAYNQCKNNAAYINNYWNKYFCDNLSNGKGRPAIPAQSEGFWYKAATEETYDFCIRENGLWR